MSRTSPHCTDGAERLPEAWAAPSTPRLRLFRDMVFVLGLGDQAQGAPEPFARRRDRGCKRRGGFAGTRLAGRRLPACPSFPHRDRSWAEADPKCAGGGAPSHRPRQRPRQTQGRGSGGTTSSDVDRARSRLTATREKKIPDQNPDQSAQLVGGACAPKGKSLTFKENLARPERFERPTLRSVV